MIRKVCSCRSTASCQVLIAPVVYFRQETGYKGHPTAAFLAV
jgi:hypothetical protein